MEPNRLLRRCPANSGIAQSRRAQSTSTLMAPLYISTRSPSSMSISGPGTLMSSQPMSPPGGSLVQRLAAGRFVMTAEVVPPVSCNPDDLTARALPLRGLADAVNVTDGASAHAHMSATAAAALLVAAGIEPILQLTCRDRNRIALQGELMGAAALGVRNLLLLRGADPTAGDQPDAKPRFALHPRPPTDTARAILHRRPPHGAQPACGARFCIAQAHP